MFILRRCALILMVAAVFISLAPADAAGKKKNAMISGNEARTRSTRLTGELKWHKSMAQARTNARTQGKMIFWVNILGSLEDAT